SEHARLPEPLDERRRQHLESAEEEDASTAAAQGGESVLERVERRGGAVGHRRVEPPDAESDRQIPAGDVDEQVREAQGVRALGGGEQALVEADAVPDVAEARCDPPADAPAPP